jgi:hypothetical protein
MDLALRRKFLEADALVSVVYGRDLFMLPGFKDFLTGCRKGSKLVHDCHRSLRAEAIGRSCRVINPGSMGLPDLDFAVIVEIIMYVPNALRVRRRQPFEFRAVLEGEATPRLLRHLHPFLES